MKINTFADLCLRIILSLGRSEPQTGQELAATVGLPYNHVSKAVVRLREMGLLEVRRGRQGGASLTPAGRLATVGQVLRSLDSREDVAECIKDSGQICPLIGSCGLRSALNEAREQFYRVLDGQVIVDLRPAGPAFGVQFLGMPLPTTPDLLPPGGSLA